jgi:hypothetical protein
MKSSNKLLLIAFFIILMGISVLVISIKSFFNPDIVSKQPESSTHGSSNVQSYPFTSFEALNIGGTWEVSIQNNDDYSVKIEQSDQKQKYTINQVNQTLNINHRQDLFPKVIEGGGSNKGLPRIFINMPVLSNLSITGDFDINIHNFKNKHLSIKADGNGTINGKQNQIENLEMSNKGYVLSNFKKSFITNADIQLEGFSRLDINMTGGNLNGNISGKSQIVYHGDIQSKNIIEN